MRVTRRQLRRIIKEELLREIAVSAEPHRCFGGGMVPFGSDECVADIEMRIEDSTALRNACNTRTDSRDYHNGILKVLRRDRRAARKENVILHTPDEDQV